MFDRRFNSFIFATKLGQGEYSRVKEGRHLETNTLVAVKLIKKSKLREDTKASILREVEIMKSLSDDGFTEEHLPHVVQLFDFYDTPRQYFLVCEMMQGGELFDRIVEKTYYSVNDAKECGRTLLNAVKFLHDRKVCHRDLKPENLLLKNFKSDTLLKIADFGFARKATGIMNTQCGTPGYVAPEVRNSFSYLSRKIHFDTNFSLLKILEKYDYGLGVDIWSVGVILYTLLAGYPPFLENDQKELYRKIKSGKCCLVRRVLEPAIQFLFF